MRKLYLTNTRLENEARTLQAAKDSGYDVRFEREPMPNDAMEWNDCYRRADLVGKYGCVVSYDQRADHSPFWRAWDNIVLGEQQ